MSSESQPLVTIGVPLFRAKRFVGRILENIEAVEYPNVEYLFSDRHCLDDAIEELRSRLSITRRVRFFAARDELPWFDNYSLLAREASGSYFRLLAQDDRIVPGAVSRAVEALEAAPEAVIAYGPVEVIDANDRLLVVDSPSVGHESSEPAHWSRYHSLLLYAGARYRTANLGLIRRRTYARDDLRVPMTSSHTGLSFRAWLFAISLRGSLCSVPEYLNRRCVHPENFTSRHFGYSLGEKVMALWSYYRAALGFWRDARSSRLERWVAAPLLLAGASLAMPWLGRYKARERKAIMEAMAADPTNDQRAASG